MLTTLESVKAWLGANNVDAARDALLNSLIKSCSSEIISYLNRNIESDYYEELYSGSGKNYLTVANYPIQTILDVKIGGVSYPQIEKSDFTTRGVKINQDRVISAQGFCFPQGFENVYITYIAGYDTVPLDIQQACNEMITMRYKNERGDKQGVSSKSLAGESISFFHGAMSNSVKAMLQDYKNVVPL